LPTNPEGTRRRNRKFIHRLPAWGTTVGPKVSVAPKVHVLDSGLGPHLLRLTREKLTRRQPQALTEFEHLVEAFAVGEIRKQAS
jgi:predicted AAA+ superfamily ATPase